MAMQASTPSATKTGLLPMLAFWCLVMGLVYWQMDGYIQGRQAQVTSSGELVLKRAPDGHFYTPGMVNGHEVRFLVDTGASIVSVSEAFARKAALPAGVPTTFKTANGDRPGRIVEGITVAVGPHTVRPLPVGVGLQMDNAHDALLGQAFLRKFDVIIRGQEMVLRPRSVD